MHLEADNLTFRYPRRNTAPVLDGISFSLRSGERVGLSAPSGRGKTTLCRLLAGWEKPDRGQVLLDGAPLPRRGFCPLLKLKAALYEAGPVNREVLEGLRIQESWLERYPSELSGGELQRICVARTLRPELKFLLCDEASAMLDLITQAQLWRFLLDYAQAHRLGLLIVSHDLSLLSRLCTRVLTWADLTRTPEKASGG